MDANEARTFHMRQLVAKAGGSTEWSRRYGGVRWQQPQVSQWISEDSPKGIGKRLARDLETAQGLPRGYLDQIPSQYPASQSAEPFSVHEETPSHYGSTSGMRVSARGVAVVDAQGQAQISNESEGYFLVDVADDNAYCLRIKGPGAPFIADPGWYVLLAPSSPPESSEKVVAKFRDGRYLAGVFDRQAEDEVVIRKPDGQLAVIPMADLEYIHPVHGYLSPKQLRK